MMQHLLSREDSGVMKMEVIIVIQEFDTKKPYLKRPNFPKMILIPNQFSDSSFPLTPQVTQTHQNAT